MGGLLGDVNIDDYPPLADTRSMLLIVETPLFTKQIMALATDEE